MAASKIAKPVLKNPQKNTSSLVVNTLFESLNFLKNGISIQKSCHIIELRLLNTDEMELNEAQNKDPKKRPAMPG